MKAATRAKLLFLFSLAGLFFSRASLLAADVKLAWDPNAEPDLAGYNLYYGTSSSSYAHRIDVGNTTAYTVSGLQPGTYYFAVTAYNTSGLESGFSNEVSTTLPGIPTGGDDTSPPVITAVTTGSVGQFGAVISWTTQEPATSQVEYGTSSALGSLSTVQPDPVLAHTVVLTGLRPGTTYYYVVRSLDAAGNTAVSAAGSFTTAPFTSTLMQQVLYFPRPFVASQGNTGIPGNNYAGIALANLDTEIATLIFTAYDSKGVPITGTNISNPAYGMLKPGEQMPLVDWQLFCEGQCDLGAASHIRVESTTSKIAGIYLLFDGNLNVADGAAVTANPTSSFILPELGKDGFARAEIVNPGADPVSVAFQLFNADGLLQKSAERTIPGNGALLAGILTDLFPDASPSSASYLRASATGGVVPFEIFGKESLFVQALDGQEVSSGATVLYAPQFLAGAAWDSTLSAINVDGLADVVEFRFYSDDGHVLGFKELPIKPRGKLSVKPGDFLGITQGELIQGYVQVRSRQVRLVGNVTFGDPQESRFASALPLVAALQESQVFSHIATNDTFFMGIAVVNPNARDIAVTLEAYGADGARLAAQTMMVPAMQRKSLLLAQYLPQLAGAKLSSGHVRITATAGVAAFALFGTTDMRFLSAIPAQPMP